MNGNKIRQILQLLIVVLVLAPLAGCAPWYHGTVDRPIPGIDNGEVLRVVIAYANDLRHDKRMRLENSKIHYGGDGTYIQQVHLKFITQNIMELWEAREVLVDVTQGLLERINNDPVLGPLVSSYPLMAEDLKIEITCESYHVLYVDKLYIHYVVLEDGVSYFYAGDITNEFSIWDRSVECWNERFEPYYKSLQIVITEREAEKAWQEKHAKPDSFFSEIRFVGEEEPVQPQPSNRASSPRNQPNSR